MFWDTGEWLPTPYLNFSTGILGLTVLIAFIAVFGLLAYSLSHQLKNIQLRGWLLTSGLCLLAVAAGILGNPLLKELAIWTQLEHIINFPWVVPFIGLLLSMLAAIWINPAASVLVALSYSITFGFWHAHHIYDVFTPVFVAALVALLMQLRMEGRLYKWLRTPVMAGMQGAILQLFLIALSTFAIVSVSRSFIGSINSTLVKTWTEAIPVFVIAVVAGLIITAIRRVTPYTTQHPEAIGLPFSNNLNGRIIMTFLFIAALLTFLMVIVSYGLTRSTMTGSTVDRIAEQVLTVSKVAEDFQLPRSKLLEWAAKDINTIADIGSESGNTLNGKDLLLDSFESITVLNRDQSILANFPDGSLPLLTGLERAAVAEVLLTGTPVIVPAEGKIADDSLVSFVVGAPTNQQADKIVIGRVAADEVAAALESIKLNFSEGYAFIRYNGSEFTITPDAVKIFPEPGDVTQFSFSDEPDSDSWDAIAASLGASDRNYSEFSKAIFGDDWSIGLVVPRDELLASGLSLIGQGLFVFILGLIFATVMLYLIVDSASHVIQQITRQTQRAASQGIDSPVKGVGEGDEIGGLATAFRRLQIAYRQQWEEQRLLLAVSEEIATTFDFHRGMPTILNAALIGLGGSGARIVIVRKADNKILSFTQPPDIKLTKGFNQKLLQTMQDGSELICRSQEEVSSVFSDDLPGQDLPHALVAIPLKTDEQHLGLIWVWRKEARYWKASQLRFLRTLASNASTLIANAKLLAGIEQGRRRLSAVLSSTSDAVLATNESNRVMLCNGAMEQYFNLKSQEILGKKLESVLHNQDLIEALGGNGADPAHVEVKGNDGLVLDGLVSTLSYNGGNSAGAVVVLRDVTRFKKLDEMKTEFVANVSHDLRSPLTQMLTYSQLIPMDGPLTEKQTIWLSRVERAVVDMKDLIEVLLDLNRLEAGVSLVKIPFRMEDIFQRIVKSYSEEARANGLHLTYHVEDFLPVVDGDVDLIRQAISNVVSNAIKYAPSSGDLTLGAETRRDELVICVTDNGPGIAESEVGRVFEKFYRTRAHDSGNVAGKGLGLALVKSIAERHGGRAWCESRLSIGTRFYIALPIFPNGSEFN